MANSNPLARKPPARVRMRFRAITVTYEGDAIGASSVIAQAILSALNAPEPRDDEDPLSELGAPEPE